MQYKFTYNDVSVSMNKKMNSKFFWEWQITIITLIGLFGYQVLMTVDTPILIYFQAQQNMIFLDKIEKTLLIILVIQNKTRQKKTKWIYYLVKRFSAPLQYS